MINATSRGEKVFNIINIVFFLLISFSMLYPFINLLAISLSSNKYVLAQKVSFYPMGFTVDAYISLFTTPKIFMTLWNTVYVTVIGTVVNVLLTTIFAYPLSRKYFYPRRIVLKLVVFTMLFNGGIIPNYVLIRQLNLIDSLWSLILPGAIGTYYLILLITFFKSVPDEMEESARIDGASTLRILLSIIIPLSKSALATIALFYAVLKWNTFFNAVIYINDLNKSVLQVMLRQIIIMDEPVGSSGSDAILSMLPETKKAASIFYTIIPILFVYPFLQKYFVKGVMIGSIKG